LREVFLCFFPSPVFHSFKLSVSLQFLLLYFLLFLSVFLLFPVIEEFQMGFLCFSILICFLLQCLFLNLFCLFLLIKFNFHEPPSFRFSSLKLFLLFIVQKCIELLNSSPFIFLLLTRAPAQNLTSGNRSGVRS